MRILHICNAFFGSQVHMNLYRELDAVGVEQTVYTYHRKGFRSLTGRNSFDANATSFLYRPILRPIHRLLYHKKIKDVYADLKKEVGAEPFDISHATTLFSDGALAYQLYRDMGVPYVVAVRSTDASFFLRFAPWTWHKAKQVLLNAERIVFISPAIKKHFCSHIYLRGFMAKMETKFDLLPNGVDHYWLEHLELNTPRERPDREILYVGTFIKRKNAGRLIRAVMNLQKRIPDVKLHFVGSGGKMEKQVREVAASCPDHFKYHGRITDKTVLQAAYRHCSVFALPSRHETFGLVYIEALSQGEKVLYAKNDGVDGLIPLESGRAVRPNSIKDIETALYDLLTEPGQYRSPDKSWFDTFSWKQIGARYVSIYQDILMKHKRNDN